MVGNILQAKLMKHVQDVLKIKDERNVHADKKIEHFQKWKQHLGKEQELTRRLNEKLEEFEEYRISGTVRIGNSNVKKVKR
ncbi:hypothetical protein LCGC14_1544820 [marine sediment metagenome]|uniref:Uncharacterized protein n=1 Tax=marine sediment metagenome TaxID=412755 RepID=A0A0F9IRV7_9ZZZZ